LVRQQRFYRVANQKRAFACATDVARRYNCTACANHAALFAHHPEWTRQAPLEAGGRWTWYFAFHQVSDENVADQFLAYQQGLLARQQWTARLGWLLSAATVETMLHRVAETDLQAQLAYQARITDFHA